MNSFDPNNNQGPYQDPNQVPYQDPNQVPYQDPNQIPYEDPNQGYYQDPYQGYDQTQYQMPYQNINQMQYQTPQQEMEDNNRANKLCIISVAMAALGCIVLPGLNALILNQTDSTIQTPGAIGLATLAGICNIAALVLMIVARVRYPKSVFAKVLMWVYIIAIILWIIAVVIVVATCVWFLSQCWGY